MVLRYVEVHRLGRDSCIGVTAVAFNPNGSYLAAAGLDGKVRIWNVETGQMLYIFSSTVPMLSLAWVGGQGDTVLCGLKDGSICRLTATEVTGFWAHSLPVEYLAVRGDLLASGAFEEVRVWKPHNEAWLMEAMLPAPPKTSFNRLLQVVVTSIHWVGESGRRAQLLVTYLNHGVHIFDGTTWEQIRTVPIPGQIADASLSCDGRLIAISNMITGFDVYLLETGAAICSLGHTVNEYRKIPVLFIHDAGALLGGNLQGDVHLWDVSSGRKLHSLLHQKEDQILALAAHYDPASDTFLIATGILGGASASESAVILWKAEELSHQEDHSGDESWPRYAGVTIYALATIPVLVVGFIYLM